MINRILGVRSIAPATKKTRILDNTTTRQLSKMLDTSCRSEEKQYTAKLYNKASICASEYYHTVTIRWGGEIALFSDKEKAIAFRDRVNEAIEQAFAELTED